MPALMAFLVALVLADQEAVIAPLAPDEPNLISFAPAEARFVRVVIHASRSGQPCIDELEVYGPKAEQNLALTGHGGTASASSCLPGYAYHQIRHLNDGRYGNRNSWIAASTSHEWAQIELSRAATVSRVVLSRDRTGQYHDRMPTCFKILISLDGTAWRTVAMVKTPDAADTPILPEPFEWDELLRYAFDCEAVSFQRVDPTSPLDRVLQQFDAMIKRYATAGMSVEKEEHELAKLHRRRSALGTDPPQAVARKLFLDARLAKRRLFFRDPELAALERILFVKRQPFLPSHNYSVILDAKGSGGGAVCLLEIPCEEGRLEPRRAKVVRLFEAEGGILRNPMADFSASQIHFAYAKEKGDYYHLMVMNADGSDVRQLTEGPFHDFWPCPLPDGGLAFISTRCCRRFLCWRPQSFVLFRMELDGSDIRLLSHANLSEWAPSVMRDGRIIWTRSEYLDKGADFGHTLWAIRPDGEHSTLLFGNNTINCYANGREVPGTGEICCTLISHGGDLNGPIAFIDPSKGRFNPEAITTITPDIQFHTHMSWARKRCFRDPVPLTRDHVLLSHAPEDRFGLYVIDRYGNREILCFDSAIGCMCPTPFRAVVPPPVLRGRPAEEAADREMGQFMVADVYRGLEPAIRRGAVKYLRVCEEVRSDLIRLPNGEYKNDHEPFQDWYATPTHKVQGPNGWPSYVAKATHGIVPVEADGSANFNAPAGAVLYFQALDKEFNELQRMRSVVQLQPGETRGCIGCHESRSHAPPVRRTLALRRAPDSLIPPPWGAGPFSYEEVVQPVWDGHCISCHDGTDDEKIDLTGRLDPDRVPASFRTIITRGWVHYFTYCWNAEHRKAEPRTFGSLESTLVKLLEAGHHDVKLSMDDMRRIKCWIDLNCPLWPDYRPRLERPASRVVRAPK